MIEPNGTTVVALHGGQIIEVPCWRLAGAPGLAVTLGIDGEGFRVTHEQSGHSTGGGTMAWEEACARARRMAAVADWSKIGEDMVMPAGCWERLGAAGLLPAHVAGMEVPHGYDVRILRGTSDKYAAVPRNRGPSGGRGLKWFCTFDEAVLDAWRQVRAHQGGSL